MCLSDVGCMHLLLIIDSLGSGGAQRQMVTLASGLAARGHHVEIFTYFDEDHFAHVAQQAGVILHVHPKPSRYSLKPLHILRKLLKSGKFDCALAFLETPCVYAELARIGIAGTPLVVSERSCYSRATMGWRGRITQELHRLASWITVNSFQQQRVMAQMFPWMASRITVIWNGVDLDHFERQPLPVPRANVLRVQVLASVARNKNPLGLAKAIVLCREKHGLRVDVNWAGTPTVSEEGDVAKQEADAFLLSAEAMSQWHWAGEIKDVRPLLAGCDVMVHPSFAEGLPNAICEALSCGRPVLASDIGDHAALVDGGANGRLFDPGDPASIADALLNYAKMGAIVRQGMAEAARRFAEERLSTGRFVQAYEALFEALARGRAA